MLASLPPEVLERAMVTDPFAVQLAHRLRGHDPRTDPALAWLDWRLAAQGTSVEAAVQEEMQQQGMGNATVRNIITSLRLTAGMDWTDFFERVSLVDAALAGSAPAGMDFPTRNLYRTAIEGLARGSGQAELSIAQDAVARAAGHPGGRQADPGYHLTGGGRPGFEAAIDYQPPLRVRLERGCRTSASAAMAQSWLPLQRLSSYCRCGLRQRPGLRPRAGAARRRRLRACVRRGGRVREPAGELGLRRHHPARPGTGGRRPRRASHPRCCPDPADQRRRRGGPGCAAGDPLPRQRGRRGALRPADRLGRQPGRERRTRMPHCSPPPWMASPG